MIDADVPINSSKPFSVTGRKRVRLCAENSTILPLRKTSVAVQTGPFGRVPEWADPTFNFFFFISILRQTRVRNLADGLSWHRKFRVLLLTGPPHSDAGGRSAGRRQGHLRAAVVVEFASAGATHHPAVGVSSSVCVPVPETPDVAL